MSFGNFVINSKSDLIAAINEYGFLPFFENTIDGFSIEEHITPDCWWHSATGEWSAWEWKGPVIQETGCAYGKFFEKKPVMSAANGFLILPTTAATAMILTPAMTTGWFLTGINSFMT